jgi:HEAT repeat protein
LLKDREVRDFAVSALGGIGPDAKAAVPALTELLKDSDYNETTDLLFALGCIGPEAKTAVPKIIALLDDHGDVRFAALSALGGIGPNAKLAIPALTRLLEDKDASVRMTASDTLEKIRKEITTKRDSPKREERGT